MGKPQVSHASADSTRGPESAELLISETFSSRQGEGKLTGVNSFFIRTSGCNLRCWFCDTPYASWNPSGEKWSIDSLVDAALASGHGHVVLTGGEPLLSPAAEGLSIALMRAGLHLTIETAGTIEKPIPCDLLSLSPKLADSCPDAEQHPRWNRLHQQRRMPLATMGKLIAAAKAFQLKYVVGDPSQMAEVQTITRSLGVDHDEVFIMPQGVTNGQMDEAEVWLRPLCENAGYRYCDRMQIRWFGNRRGT